MSYAEACCPTCGQEMAINNLGFYCVDCQPEVAKRTEEAQQRAGKKYDKPNETPTPRTDVHARCANIHTGTMVVYADFARTLECELVEANAKIAEWKEQWRKANLHSTFTLIGKEKGLQRELRNHKTIAKLHADLDETQSERDSYRECARELADSLRTMLYPQLHQKAALDKFNQLELCNVAKTKE